MSLFEIYAIGVFINLVLSFRKYFHLIDIDPSSENKVYKKIKELRKQYDESFQDKIKIFILPYSYILEYLLFKQKAMAWMAVNKDKNVCDYYIAYLEYNIKKEQK